MVILSTIIYNEVVEFIRNHDGLPFDEEADLQVKFPNVNAITLSSILAREWQEKIKAKHTYMKERTKKFIQEYRKHSSEAKEDDILLKIALREQFAPFALCRLILSEYHFRSLTKQPTKPELNEMLRNPSLIPDSLLGANVSTCLYNDYRDGPIPDAIRQSIGEEYEHKLKQLAKDAGLHFFDEEDLRRIGFDKTPDLKLAVPCLYKGSVIHWIESKASFGDMESHRKYVRDQLISYGNRFGAGIVIYWFGFLDKILDHKVNGNNIHILDSFPDKSDLVLLSSDDENKLE
ncbi:CDAN1-interacting nuclease 1 [Pseudolycoriella hygida]|uniref:CDAN1-interacting nuclease 1 n=1 Tax=Pseudolycoriella hygida TaxID=35572 RepID=A0A9Q0S5Q5_9DIPT|nr:CDAN1-interacting nuclease 1 [Pseudolycoriella hygida]